MRNESEIVSFAELQVLRALEGGLRTWKDIKTASRLDDERIGIALAKLFDKRQVKTGYRG